MEREFQPEALLMAPCFSPRPWGGEKLAAMLHKTAPPGPEPIGESWELSDHPDGRSTVASPPLAGSTFGELVRDHPLEMCGLAAAPARYPLLVKYVDAASDLSLQVHPSDAQAAGTRDRGKNECWLVLDCPEGAEVIHGLAPGVDAAALRQAIERKDLNPCLRRLPIRPGDFIEVPAGTVHAILGGTMVCEVQQSSNLTYRLWDWERRPERKLHVREALRVARFGPAGRIGVIHTDRKAPDHWHILARNAFFEVRLKIFQAGGGGPIRRANPHGLVLNVVQGGGILEWRGGAAALELGQTWFLMAGLGDWKVEAGAAGLRLLVSESLEF